jgi:hypothetical protein
MVPGRRQCWIHADVHPHITAHRWRIIVFEKLIEQIVARMVAPGFPPSAGCGQVKQRVARQPP